MRQFFKNNGLSIALFGIFALVLVGQYITGWMEHSEDQRLHGKPTVSILQYATEGHFIEATFENWESEFLQMMAYVLLTVFLYQKGSSESKSIDTVERVDLILPESKDDPEMPWPVRKGGIVLRIYENSLAIALFLLFAVSFVLHGLGGASEYNSEQIEHGLETITTLQYFASTRFWFESFQNWQSEFLSVGVIVVFTIFLRQKGSSESKPVDTPHSETSSG